MKIFTCVMGLMFAYYLSHSQGNVISGVVQDTSGRALEWASAVLYFATDTTMAGFSYSDKYGAFSLKNVKGGEYILQISYLGTQTYYKDLDVTSHSDLGEIVLQPSSLQMDEVEISAFRVPVLIKKDTVEYAAESFKTGPNASVEDLLKRMPGIEVDQEGSIKAQGEDVKHVLVDGKRFFGNDPKIATKNLPADVIDKVQVYDRKSEIAEFTGVDDGNREKTINLKLKEDKKNGVFGYASAGIGPDQRHDGKLSMNKFTPNNQMAILAGVNNINQQGFSIQDYMQFSGIGRNVVSGGGGVIMVGGNDQNGPMINRGTDMGFINSLNGGMQFNTQYGKDRELNASFFYSRSDQNMARDVNRTNFLPQGGFFNTIDNSQENSIHNNHRFNLNWEHALHTKSSIKLNSSISYTGSENNLFKNTTNSGESGISENESITQTKSGGNSISANGALIWRYNISRRGRFVSATIHGRHGGQSQNGSLLATNTFFQQGIPLLEESIDQVQEQLGKNYTLGTKLLFTEPFGDRQYIDFEYNYQNSPMRNNREVFDILEDRSPIINPLLSDRYNATFAFHSPGIQYRIVRNKWNAQARLHLQFSILDGELQGTNGSLRRDFTYFMPSFSSNIPFSMAKNLNIDYSTQIREPSILQLQPIPDNRDPLNIYIGNPELSPEYNHRFSVRYTQFNPSNFRSLFLFGNISYTRDKIREDQTINEQLVRTRRPINVDGEWDMNTRVNYGIRFPTLNFNVNLSGGLHYTRGISFVNTVENQTQRITPTGELRVTYLWKNILDIEASSSFNLTQTLYSVQQELNQKFKSYIHRWNIRLNPTETWQFVSGLTWSQFKGDAGVFNQDIPIWKASISRFIMGKKAEIKVLAYDIMNKNVGIQRTSDFNYIQDEQVASLGRYAMVQFRYNFNAFQAGAQRGGAVFRTM